MGKIKGMLPDLAYVAAAFYLLPLLMRNTGGAMILMLVLLPLLCLLLSMFYGARRGFHPLYAVLVALLFVPSLFLYYNASAWVYAPAYGLIALAGNALGLLFNRGR